MKIPVEKIIKESSDFPPQLKEIKDCPEALYVKGFQSPIVFERCVAIVGSRNMSPYGSRVVKKLMRELADLNVVIVSGFMRGVDLESHRSALEMGLRTIAVLPYGIEKILTSEQEELANLIISSGGMVVSEYDGDQDPQKWMFVKRNRIIAGLSLVVIVVEASDQSGSLITAEMARSYSRPVYAVPGNIFSDTSEGTTVLLKSIAKPISSAFDIKELLDADGVSGIPAYASSRVRDAFSFDSLEKLILKKLESLPMTIDEVISHINRDEPREIGVRMSALYLKGCLEERDGKYYVKRL